jgi:hypothetical protein
MLKSITSNAIIAVAAAGFVAGLAIASTFAAPAARAESFASEAFEQPLAKGDRRPAVVTGSACSTRSWPNYDLGCQFDRRRPDNAALTVRIIALR